MTPRQYKLVCSEAYVVIGVLAEICGQFENPRVQRALDNLSAASAGKPKLPHKTFLPFGLKKT